MRMPRIAMLAALSGLWAGCADDTGEYSALAPMPDAALSSAGAYGGALVDGGALE